METINLLNGKEFCPNFSIKERLEEGAKSHSLIYTDNLRGVGKTYSLIEFAKQHKYIVAVRNTGEAKRLIEEYDYKDIYGQEEYILHCCKNIIIDETVKFGKNVEKESVLTGFTNIKPTENFETELRKFVDSKVKVYENIVEDLKKDAISLSNKLSKNENNSDYKMMINNLKTTMELIQELEGKQDPTTVNISNVTVNEVTSAEEFISQLKQLAITR